MHLRRVVGADAGLPVLPGAAKRAPRVVLRSNQDAQTWRIRKQFRSLCAFVNRFFRTQAQKPTKEIFSGICSRFSEAVRVFLFQGFSPLFHDDQVRALQGNRSSRRRQMNDFWKLEDLGIPSDAARQIREQHERELAAERDARRQAAARDVRRARAQTPKTAFISEIRFR